MHQTLSRLLAPPFNDILRKFSNVFRILLDIGVRGGPVTPISAVLAKAAVHKLLLAVVAELARHLPEAGLHQGHVGEGNTRATLFLEILIRSFSLKCYPDLVLHRTDEAEVHGAVGGGHRSPAVPHALKISL